ncbi:MAG: PIN domain-containing protein [Flavobacteriales bacterium]|nr:PIN domain-containing protein [Flavobacteriales bacterium]
MGEEPQAAHEVKLVVDTNIVFSAILNSNSRIARILTSGRRHFEFYSCEFLRIELIKHRPKLRKLTHLSEADLDEVIDKVTTNIRFINESTLPAALLLRVESNLALVDPKDTPFVALAKRIKARLWTGDKALVKGLGHPDAKLPITTAELLKRLDELES